MRQVRTGSNLPAISGGIFARFNAMCAQRRDETAITKAAWDGENHHSGQRRPSK